MEPDAGFGSVPSWRVSVAVLFARDQANSPDEASPDYRARALAVQLAAHLAEGALTGEQHAQVVAQLLQEAGSESERRRLAALLGWALSEPPPLASLSSLVSGLDGAGHQVTAALLARLAEAGSRVLPGRLQELGAPWKLLAVHLDSGGLGVRPVALDPEKIALLQDESERVKVVLDSVFKDERPPAAGSPQPPAPAGRPGLLGLDPVSSEFLRSLLRKVAWSRAELAALARERGLPLDGVLERLNEASLDSLEMPLIEDGDPIVLNPEAVAALSAGDQRAV
jgi:hypothetical protein